MTIEKAIYQLEDLIKDRESFCYRDDFDDVFLQDIEACKMGVQALEKQMSKKLIEKNPWIYTCPCCNSQDTHTLVKRFAYCPDCGQALDWSDENA